MQLKAIPQFVLHLIRQWVVSNPYAKPVDLTGKKMIITGASPGSLGFETAKTLALWGASVIITTRSHSETVAKDLIHALSEKGNPTNIDSHPLDLSQSNSVIQFVDWYLKTHGEQLDVLINNAGVHLDLLSRWKEPRLSDDGFEIQWRTNYLGTMHLTHSLLPILQKTGQTKGEARIVNVVSQLHKKGSNAWLFEQPPVYNSWVAYGLSKLALIHATIEIQRRFAQPFHLQAYCLHPGSVFTQVANKGLEGNPMIESVRKVFAPVERFFLKTPEEGSQTQIHCATAPKLQGGLYYKQCQPALASPDTQDAEVSKRLWDQTEDRCKKLRSGGIP